MIQKLPEGWKVRALGEVTDIFKGGTPKRSVERYFQGDIAWATPTDITKLNGALYIDDTETHISEEGLGKSSARLLPSGTVLLTSRATIGKVAISRIPISTNQGFANFLCKEEINNLFLAYYLKLKKDMLISLGTGTTFLEVTKARLLEVEIPLPPLPNQRKIAAILSAYDDLIENNTRRIKILEDMAQTLYQEWFVHFRFPGHENVPMVESPLGPIPQGWEVKNFGEVSINFDRQRKPLSGQVRSTMQGEYPYYGAAKILDHINDYLFDGRYLLIGEDGSVVTEDGKPVLQLVTGKFWVNNHTHVVQGKSPISTNFLYLFMSNISISGYVTGTAQPKINQQNLNRIPIISPPQSLLEKFNQMIEPSFDNIVALNLKNANLRQTRDLLLRKLISGEIDVSELDIDNYPKSN